MLLVGAGHRHPLVDVEPLRELGENVFLIAPQVGRRHLLPELARSDFRGTDRQVWPEIADEITEFLDPVLQRGAGQEDRSLRAIDQGRGAQGSLGARILDVVRFVEDQACRSGAFRYPAFQPTEDVVGGDRDSTVADPGLQRVVATGPVQATRAQRGLGLDFAHPVGHDSGGAHDQEVGGALGAQVGAYGECFDCLSQPHLVADDDLALHDREAGTERLVPTQGRLQMAGVELEFPDRLDDFGR